LWFRRDLWNQEIWQAVRDLVINERPSKHPRTVEIRAAPGAQQAFLKIFFATSTIGALKDCFRRSNAVRALLIGETLADQGFNAPLAIGAGEERYADILRRSFLITLPVHGLSLPQFLRDRWAADSDASAPQKYRMIAQLAREIRRFHDLGFVHGDLVPGNIFIALEAQQTARFCFMDNDRTRRYPAWLRQRLWRRNLLQLNRFPLPGISLQDRVRFFHAYVQTSKAGSKERRLLHWLEQKTRQRRSECDAVDTSGSFRRLMRWERTSN
jgi:serine/threonine protein kinase